MIFIILLLIVDSTAVAYLAYTEQLPEESDNLIDKSHEEVFVVAKASAFLSCARSVNSAAAAEYIALSVLVFIHMACRCNFYDLNGFVTGEAEVSEIAGLIAGGLSIIDNNNMMRTGCTYNLSLCFGAVSALINNCFAVKAGSLNNLNRS